MVSKNPNNFIDDMQNNEIRSLFNLVLLLGGNIQKYIGTPTLTGQLFLKLFLTSKSEMQKKMWDTTVTQ